MKDGKYNVFCPICGHKMMRGQVIDAEVKCGKCRALWSVRMIDKELLVREA